MTNKQTSKFTRNLGIVAFLDDNTAAYAGDVAFEAIVTKIKIDIAAADAAAVETAADNTGYSIDKLIAKNDVSELASELCASSQVILDILGNHTLSQSLNSTTTFYSHVADTLSVSRLQNVHDVMFTNLALITTSYLTGAQLTTFQTKIDKFSTIKGNTTAVNTNSPVLTKELKDEITVTNADVITLRKLGKKYKKSNPTFFNSLVKFCKTPASTVRHTPVNITVTDAATSAKLSGVSGTLSKTKELGMSTSDGIINYSNVSAGSAIATYSLDGYLTKVQNVKIKRGKTNTLAVALTVGTMTAEMEEAVTLSVNEFIAAEETKKAAKAVKEKARKDAKKAAVSG